MNVSFGDGSFFKMVPQDAVFALSLHNLVLKSFGLATGSASRVETPLFIDGYRHRILLDFVAGRACFLYALSWYLSRCRSVEALSFLGQGNGDLLVEFVASEGDQHLEQIFVLEIVEIHSKGCGASIVTLDDLAQNDVKIRISTLLTCALESRKGKVF